MAKRYPPLIDKLYWMLFIPTVALTLLISIIPSLEAPKTLFLTVPIFLFLIYFFISPLFGYVELRESTLFIKYGLILKREIPYKKIRGTEKKHAWYSDSMLSLKNSLDHVNIKYNTFDLTAVSVKGNDEFISELEALIDKAKSE